MQSKSLIGMMNGQIKGKDAALFGYFGGAINITDGHHTYHKFPPDLSEGSVNQYTLMPTHIFDFFSVEELAQSELSPPLSFTKGVPLLKVPVTKRSPMYDVYGPGSMLENETRLYCLESDPGQDQPLNDPVLESQLVDQMIRLMKELDAPDEVYARLKLDPDCGST